MSKVLNTMHKTVLKGKNKSSQSYCAIEMNCKFNGKFNNLSWCGSF